MESCMHQTRIIYNSIILFLSFSIYAVSAFADKKEDTGSIGESVGDIIDSFFGEEKERSNNQVENILEHLEQMSPNERLGFNKKLRDMSPAERKQFRKKLRGMTKEERKEYFNERRKQFRENRVKECERRSQMRKQKDKSKATEEQEIASIADITIDDIVKRLFDKQNENIKDQIDNIKNHVAKMSPGERRSFNRDLRDMNAKERKQFRKELRNMSPKEKRKYFRERSQRGCKRNFDKFRLPSAVIP